MTANPGDRPEAERFLADKIYDRQPFHHAGGSAFINRDGQAIQLDVWLSRCLECGATFKTTSVVGQSPFKPGHRRCERHRRRFGMLGRSKRAGQIRDIFGVDPRREDLLIKALSNWLSCDMPR